MCIQITNSQFNKHPITNLAQQHCPQHLNDQMQQLISSLNNLATNIANASSYQARSGPNNRYGATNQYGQRSYQNSQPYQPQQQQQYAAPQLNNHVVGPANPPSNQPPRTNELGQPSADRPRLGQMSVTGGDKAIYTKVSCANLNNLIAYIDSGAVASLVDDHFVQRTSLKWNRMLEYH